MTRKGKDLNDHHVKNQTVFYSVGTDSPPTADPSSHPQLEDNQGEMHNYR